MSNRKYGTHLCNNAILNWGQIEPSEPLKYWSLPNVVHTSSVRVHLQGRPFTGRILLWLAAESTSYLEWISGRSCKGGVDMAFGIGWFGLSQWRCLLSLKRLDYALSFRSCLVGNSYRTVTICRRSSCLQWVEGFRQMGVQPEVISER